MKHVLKTIMGLSLLAAAGCQHTSKDDPHKADLKVPIIEKTYEMAGVGQPPLSLIVTNGGWIKIVDATDNTLIHTAQLPATVGGLVVRLDPELKGVVYSATSDKGEKPTIVQPIDPTHRFEIYYQR